MFNSIFSQKWLKWACQPKKYVVNVVVKVSDSYKFIDVEVFSRSKSEASKQAIEKIKSEIKIYSSGQKSLGRTKSFNEIVIK